MRSWLVKLIKFQPVICIALQWHHNVAPWYFLQKSGSKFASFAQICTYQKSQKLMFSQHHVTKCVHGWLNWSNSNLLCALHSHYNESPWPFTSKVVVAGFATKKPQKMVFSQHDVTDCDHCGLNWSHSNLLCALHCSDIITKPHDYLLQKSG